MSTHSHQADQIRLVREKFTKANATTPQSAVPLPALGKGERRQLDQMLESGVVKMVERDRYYLDQSAAGAGSALALRVTLATLAISAGAIVFGATWSSVAHPEFSSRFGRVTLGASPTHLTLREPAIAAGAPRMCFRFRNSSQRANAPGIRAALVRDDGQIDTFPPSPFRRTGDETSCLEWLGPAPTVGEIRWTAAEVWSDAPIEVSQIRVRVPRAPRQR